MDGFISGDYRFVSREVSGHEYDAGGEDILMHARRGWGEGILVFVCDRSILVQPSLRIVRLVQSNAVQQLDKDLPVFFVILSLGQRTPG